MSTHRVEGVPPRQTALSETGGFGKAGVTVKGAPRQVGRPRVNIDGAAVLALRAAGLSWRQVARRLGIGVETARRLGRVEQPGGSAPASPRPSQNPTLAFPQVAGPLPPSPEGQRFLGTNWPRASTSREAS